MKHSGKFWVKALFPAGLSQPPRLLSHQGGVTSTVLKGPRGEPWLDSSLERSPHLAGLVVHVEGGDDSLCQLSSLPKHQVLGQPVGQVGLPGAAGAGENDAPVLHQQGDVALQDGLGDQGLECQRVQAVLREPCVRDRVSEVLQKGEPCACLAGPANTEPPMQTATVSCSGAPGAWVLALAWLPFAHLSDLGPGLRLSSAEFLRLWARLVWICQTDGVCPNHSCVSCVCQHLKVPSSPCSLLSAGHYCF